MMGLDEQIQKDIKIISEALLSIIEWECCDYGFEEAADLAEKYLYGEENDEV